MEIYERMFSIMEEKKIKSIDLAEKIGVTKGVISNWKKRGTNPPIEYMVAICELLDVTYEYFLTGKHTKTELNTDELILIENYRKCSRNNKEQLYKLSQTLGSISFNEEAAALDEGKSSDYKIG